MTSTAFLQATSSVVVCPLQSLDHPGREEPQHRKDHSTLRGQPQNMSKEAHILAIAGG